MQPLCKLYIAIQSEHLTEATMFLPELQAMSPVKTAPSFMHHLSSQINHDLIKPDTLTV